MNSIRQAPGTPIPGKPLRNNDLQGHYSANRLIIVNFIYDMFLLILAFVLIVGAL